MDTFVGLLTTTLCDPKMEDVPSGGTRTGESMGWSGSFYETGRPESLERTPSFLKVTLIFGLEK